MKKYINSLIIILLVLSNIFSSYHLRKLNQEYNKIALHSCKEDANVLYWSFISFEQIEDSLISLISQNEKITGFVNGQNKLIFFFSEEDCQSCIIQMFMDADLLVPKIIENKLIIVGNYKNEQRFNNILALIPGDYPSINLHNENILELGIKAPFLAVLSKEFDFKFYYPYDESISLQNNYFSNILKNFFNYP